MPKRKRSGSTPHLPEEVIEGILVRLPRDFLLNTAAHVCNTWSEIIKDPTFAKKHQCKLLGSAAGVIIQHDRNSFGSQFLHIENNRVSVRVTDLDRKLPGGIIAQCEGALLVHNEICPTRLFVADCNTLEIHAVSPPPEPHVLVNSVGTPLLHLSRIARIPGTGEIKILCICINRFPVKSYYWMVRTFGSGSDDDDSWRRIDYELTDVDFFRVCLGNCISIGGVIYIAGYGYRYLSSPLCAIDLGRESAHKLPLVCATPPPKCNHIVYAPLAGKLYAVLFADDRIVKAMALDLSCQGEEIWRQVDYFGSEIGKKMEQDETFPVACSGEEGKILIGMTYNPRRRHCPLVGYNMKTGRRIKINKVFCSGQSVFEHSPHPT